MSYYPSRTRKQPARRQAVAPASRYPVAASRKAYPHTRSGGKGAYTLEDGPWANRGAFAGGALGKAIGSMYGFPKAGRALGSWIGRRALHYPAKMFGSGSYTEVPASYDAPRRIAPQVPMFDNGSRDDSVVITHREYLGDIISSNTAGAFKMQSFALNPSELNTFPWLSNIVQPNYQQYKFDGLVFEFKSFSADALNSTNTALGSVFSCINYDYTDTDLTSRYEVENTDWSASCKPSENMIIPVECKPNQTGMNGLLYVINGNTVPANADPKMYYLGKMWIGTTGFQGTNVNIGSLYVTYKIRLYKPVMTRPISNALVYAQAREGTFGASLMFGTGNWSSPYNCDALGVTYAGSTMVINQKRLVVGQVYQLTVVWTGSAGSAFTKPTITHTGGTGLNYFSGYGLPFAFAPQDGVTCTTAIMNNVFIVTDASKDLTIALGGSPTLPGGTVSAQVNLLQICGVPLAQIGTFTP